MDLKGAILRNFYQVGTLVKEANPSDYFSLKVPHYQRPYRWDESRVAQLIKDWNENRSNSKDSQKLSNEQSQDYFAGAVVTVASDNSDEHSLIDGQQRITTLFLANYINFTIIRQLLLLEIEDGRCGRLRALSERLSESARFLFRDKEVFNQFKKVAEYITDLADEDKMEAMHNRAKMHEAGELPDETESPLDKIYKDLWICKAKDFYSLADLDVAMFKESTIKNLNECIKNDNLNLHYDRESYNANLAKVLTHFFFDTQQRVKSFDILELNNMSETEQVYTTALYTIFKEFECITEEELRLKGDDSKRNPMRSYLVQMHELIYDFLNQVKLCVIQTGAVDDAYTLFEVMNDRALALDDLDLIKNQFFKEFVQKNNDLNDEELDKKIQNLDKQWGDDIFNHREIRAHDKKLIPYLSTVFLTGDDNITNKNETKYRIDLNKYLSQIDVYNSDMIQRDFNVFQVCYELIKITYLPYQRRYNASLIVEYELGSTEFHKTMYFLNALKQEGVISGLVNFVLRTIAKFSQQFDIEVSKKFIQRLLMSVTELTADLQKNEPDQSKADEIKEAVQLVHAQSKALWQASMMASKADAPREIAKSLIRVNNMSDFHNQKALELIEPDFRALREVFSDWLSSWSYENDSVTKFKIKTLFARLLKLDRQNSKIVSTVVKTTIDPNSIIELELDHLIPQSGNEVGIFQFETEDEKQIYLHGLGNMMLLSKQENIQKSNKPLEESLGFYRTSGLGNHFLIRDLEEQLEDSEKNNIKASEFFSKRKGDLVSYFVEAVMI